MALPDQPLHARAAGDGRPLRALDGWIQWHGRALRKAVSRFVGPCRFIVDKFAEHGFDREKLRYVPNFVEGVDDAPVGAGEVAALREVHGRYILHFGRLSPEKGVDVLIDAAAAANAPLTIVGDGPQRSALEAQARALGARCLFTGHLNGAALWAEVEAATAVALPSLWYEIAPKSVLEAQARGKPIVTTRIGGLPELVEDGENGLLVERGDRAGLADALRRMLAMDEESLAAMGAKGREQATSRFTRDRYYREMTALYAELVPALKEAAQ
jgi:glycosyltransferase involved in cell wall biosynthesis